MVRLWCDGRRSSGMLYIHDVVYLTNKQPANTRLSLKRRLAISGFEALGRANGRDIDGMISLRWF